MNETPLTADDMNNLRHMLGVRAPIRKKDWGYRNHFEAAECDVPSMERLMARGLATRVRTSSLFPYPMYQATEAGCKAAGLTAAQTRRALGGVH